MYVPGTRGTGAGGSSMTGPTTGMSATALGMTNSLTAGGWGAMVRPSHNADLLATISMFEQHVKAEPMGFYSPPPPALPSSQQPTQQQQQQSQPPTSTATSNAKTGDNVSVITVPDDKEPANIAAQGVVSKPATGTGTGHSRSKPQACKVCGKVLSSASSYYVHMKLHSGNKPYTCTCCEAAFCRKPYLEVHMRTHTGERPFQCELCMKRFTQKSSLNTHKRVHTGERPYACDICEKRFAVKSYVTAHRWSHVADKPLTCDRCAMTFTSKSQFAIHIRTHSAAQSYECNICGRTFVRDSYLIRHHNRVHRDNTAQVRNVQNQSQGSATPFDNGNQAGSLRYVTTSTQMSPMQDKSPPPSVGPPSVGSHH